MKYLVAIWAITSASLVYATCTTNTYFINGRTIMCTTCCYPNVGCNTFCN